ncbi:MAG TPA: serine protease [Acetivibrio sp.]|uniref:serine protease n=1 Tax=Acetivibrio sp. TaxID=1872092 RepID=UPI002C584712|nr:serine protease [Acetivibrio sp.]HOM03429.1 serine protease [Acetivibrio sp.]
MNIRKAIIIFVIISILAMTSCSGPSNEDTPPLLSDNTVLRPEFVLKDITFSAGTAFAVELQDENVSLVLTAYHLFGESGGLDEKIPAKALPDVVEKAIFTDAYNDNLCGECEKVLKIEDADTYPEVDKDIVAFYYGENLGANRLKLSSKLPKKGETVWLAAPTILDVEPRLHKAKVKSASDKMIFFEYEDKDIILDATSGAPILNSSGEVVGLNVGGGEQYGKKIGVANPCTSIEKTIKKALAGT